MYGLLMKGGALLLAIAAGVAFGLFEYFYKDRNLKMNKIPQYIAMGAAVVATFIMLVASFFVF